MKFLETLVNTGINEHAVYVALRIDWHFDGVSQYTLCVFRTSREKFPTINRLTQHINIPVTLPSIQENIFPCVVTLPEMTIYSICDHSKLIVRNCLLIGQCTAVCFLGIYHNSALTLILAINMSWKEYMKK